MIKSAFNKLLYAVFPRRCELCGEVVSLDEKRCEKCSRIKKIDGEVCSKCARKKTDCECKNKKETPEYKAIAAPYYYEDNIVTALHRFKDFGYTELADNMGKEIVDTVSKRFNEVKFDAVAYIPMTRRKQSKRGYNQSELLADVVSKELNVPKEHLLKKIRNTKSQRGSSAKARRLNLHGAFDINNAEVKDKTILLVDDVKTTGSTLNECAMVLKGYGAKAVYAAAFAVTNKKKN